MTTTEIINTLAICNLTEKYSVAEARKAYDLCVFAARNDEVRAKEYFLEICADHSYKAAAEASKNRLLNI